jgi:hypothetical protein
VFATRAETKIVSGIFGFTFMKSTESGWDHYYKDEYTTIAETRDRVCDLDGRKLALEQQACRLSRSQCEHHQDYAGGVRDDLQRERPRMGAHKTAEVLPLRWLRLLLSVILAAQTASLRLHID